MLALGFWAALAASAVAAESNPAAVVFRERGDGALLATPAGMTLYVFGRDVEPGKSACTGPCAKTWPPYVAPADAAASGDFGVIVREDGSRQWTYRGQPLYAYSRDRAAGDTYGDDVNRVWHIAFRPIFTPPEATIATTLKGRVLANAKGLTLYTSAADKPGQSACVGACARTWVPLAAPWLAAPRGDWSVVTRPDGSRQWAFKGKPLYAHVGDAQAGVATGDGADPKWQVAVLEPPPPVPGWVRVRQSDAGELFTDARGKTIYQRDARRPQGLGFNGDDLTSSDVPRGYRPITPENTEDAKPVGNWAIVDQDGIKQWAYKGLPLYTNDNDEGADLKGVRGTDRSFHTVMRSGEPMQGTGQ
jgi:predicted lipoprotein with Yx(FWY)xxD motif